MIVKLRDTSLSVMKLFVEYLTWLAFVVSQMALILWAHQLIVTYALILAKQVRNPWLPRAMDMWSMVILGIIAMITIFVSQAYLHQGMRCQRFLRSVGLLLLIEGVVALAMFALESIWL